MGLDDVWMDFLSRLIDAMGSTRHRGVESAGDSAPSPAEVQVLASLLAEVPVIKRDVPRARAALALLSDSTPFDELVAKHLVRIVLGTVEIPFDVRVSSALSDADKRAIDQLDRLASTDVGIYLDLDESSMRVRVGSSNVDLLIQREILQFVENHALINTRWGGPLVMHALARCWELLCEHPELSDEERVLAWTDRVRAFPAPAAALRLTNEQSILRFLDGCTTLVASEDDLLGAEEIPRLKTEASGTTNYFVVDNIPPAAERDRAF
jgi:hypothetical protein